MSWTRSMPTNCRPSGTESARRGSGQEYFARHAAHGERPGTLFSEFLSNTAWTCHRRDRVAPRGALPRDDFASTAGRGFAAGPDLSGAGRERLPATGAFARGGKGDLAVRGLPRAGVRAPAHLVD